MSGGFTSPRSATVSGSQRTLTAGLVSAARWLPQPAALENLLDAGARCLATTTWMTRNPGATLERYVLSSVTLP